MWQDASQVPLQWVATVERVYMDWAKRNPWIDSQFKIGWTGQARYVYWLCIWVKIDGRSYKWMIRLLGKVIRRAKHIAHIKLLWYRVVASLQDTSQHRQEKQPLICMDPKATENRLRCCFQVATWKTLLCHLLLPPISVGSLCALLVPNLRSSICWSQKIFHKLIKLVASFWESHC